MRKKGKEERKEKNNKTKTDLQKEIQLVKEDPVFYPQE